MESKFKVFVIIAIVVLALAMGTSTFLVLRVLNNTQAEVATTGNGAAIELKSIALGDAILTNITNDNGSVQHFAKVKVSIGVDGSDEKIFTELSAEIEAKAASIRSELIATIGEQTYSMLSAGNGKEKLADEIITRLNTLLDTELIYEVYYEEYFIQ
ncbi:MAG: hypothetical protein E7231_00745 [Cellulosilyticum sp.]|nr:hypothetical protein [Cellulosilyticum sp.]